MSNDSKFIYDAQKALPAYNQNNTYTLVNATPVAPVMIHRQEESDDQGMTTTEDVTQVPASPAVLSRFRGLIRVSTPLISKESIHYIFRMLKLQPNRLLQLSLNVSLSHQSINKSLHLTTTITMEHSSQLIKCRWSRSTSYQFSMIWLRVSSIIELGNMEKKTK